MTEIVFVSDFFLEEGVLGGAETFNHELIEVIKSRGYSLNKLKSNLIQPNHIFKNKFYIISNFLTMSEEIKNTFVKESISYIILEHDHKYVATNNPTKFKNMIAPQVYVINQLFFGAAKVVYCQSKIHTETFQKNLFTNNLVNLGCNLWSKNHIEILSKYINSDKTKENVILYSNNKNKGTGQTVQFCKDKGIDFEYIMPSEYEKFIEQLSKSKTLYFFPQWLESFNRVTVEARILGCKIVTNKMIGAASEPWFKKLKGEDLLTFIDEQRENVISKILAPIQGAEPDFFKAPESPKISIITSMYKAGEYIEHFMSEVTKQIIFNKCELIILDANSPDNEKIVIDKYLEKYDNIKYLRLSETLSVQETMNIGLDMATGEYLTLWNVDDTREYGALKILSHHLTTDPNVDLVYADCFQTYTKNERFDNNTSAGYWYEHSRFEFSKKAMIKCLPGPLPMWKRKMTDDNGKFDESLKFAGDWEMWLRCVSSGSRFKRINRTLGLYYMNPDGLSTSKSNQAEKFKEERSLFNKYKDIFGEKVYNQFKEHFNG
tara:strand:+ start:196 stop:1836 length:1641 start_codon:yes stop_codon:yes gene_type:complete